MMNMKKLLFTTLITLGTLQAQAYDYPYLVFQNTEGTTTVIAVESLSITISDGQLVATNADGTQSFALTDLSKMYFSATDETAEGIEGVNAATLDEVTDIYDLQGRKVADKQMNSGIYVMKTKKGIFKVSVK